jgi:hypothetical protein
MWHLLSLCINPLRKEQHSVFPCTFPQTDDFFSDSSFLSLFNPLMQMETEKRIIGMYYGIYYETFKCSPVGLTFLHSGNQANG